jgi:hypothetical protein
MLPEMLMTCPGNSCPVREHSWGSAFLICLHLRFSIIIWLLLSVKVFVLCYKLMLVIGNFFFFLVVLRFELRAPHLLGKCSTA